MKKTDQRSRKNTTKQWREIQPIRWTVQNTGMELWSIEMVEYGHKIEERVKAMKSEIMENAQGTNSERKETGTQINSLEQKEEINIQPEQNEETRIQKPKERLRNLWGNFKHCHIWIIGVPEGEEEEQEIENVWKNNEGKRP